MVGQGGRELTQFVYSVCTALIVSFGGPHFFRMLYNLMNISLKMYSSLNKPNMFYCEMCSFNSTVNITFVRALTRRMTSLSHNGQYGTQYAYVRNLLCADLVFQDLEPNHLFFHSHGFLWTLHLIFGSRSVFTKRYCYKFHLKSDF